MKILTVLSKSPFPAHDGGALATQSLLRLLLRNGHEVSAFILSTPKHPFHEERIPLLFRSIEFISAAINTIPSVPGGIANLFSRKSYHLQRFYDDHVASALGETLEDTPFDLILMDGLYSAPYLEAIRAETAAPVILRAHNIEHEIWQRYSNDTGNPVKKMYSRLQAGRLSKEEKEILNQVDGIVAISERDEKLIRSILHENIPHSTLPFAIDLEKYQSVQELRKEAVAGHIGAMDWLPNKEGVSWFVEKVWPLVREENMGAVLKLAGRGMQAGEWKTQNGVEVEGEVDSARDFIRSLRVFVVPLFSGSGLRIKILEAMALGIPVVATSMAAEAIPARHGEHIFLADTPEEFAGYVSDLLANEEKAKAIGQNGRKLIAQKYSEEALSNKLEDFIGEVMS